MIKKHYSDIEVDDITVEYKPVYCEFFYWLTLEILGKPYVVARAFRDKLTPDEELDLLESFKFAFEVRYKALKNGYDGDDYDLMFENFQQYNSKKNDNQT